MIARHLNECEIIRFIDSEFNCVDTMPEIKEEEHDENFSVRADLWVKLIITTVIMLVMNERMMMVMLCLLDVLSHCLNLCILFLFL